MGGMDTADIFSELFGGGMHFGFDFGGAGPRGARRTKGNDSTIPYDVTLEDLYNGKSVRMNMEKEIICGTCKGYVGSWCTGIVDLAGPEHSSGAKGSAKAKPCVKCEGKGWHFTTQQVGDLL